MVYVLPRQYNMQIWVRGCCVCPVPGLRFGRLVLVIFKFKIKYFTRGIIISSRLQKGVVGFPEIFPASCITYDFWNYMRNEPI